MPGRSRRAAPDADTYAATTEENTERRPRRSRSRDEAAESWPAWDEVDNLDDDALVALAERLGMSVPDDADLDDVAADVAEALEAKSAPPPPEPESRSSRRRSSRPETPELEEAGRQGREAVRARREQASDEPAPRGRSRRSAEPADEPAPDTGRRHRRGASAEDTPRFRAKSGFEGFKKVQESTSSFDDFKLTSDEVLGKFMDDEPYATFGEHGLFKELKEGQRVWLCIADFTDCPICDRGHRARPVALWNVLVTTGDGKSKMVTLKAGPKLEKILEAKAAARTGPLSVEYYSLSQSDPKDDGPTEYFIELCRERDVKAEWDIDPFTDEELDDYAKDCKDADDVEYPTQAELVDVARKMVAV